MLDLHHRQMGEGPPLVMLHGLFGSLDNLGSIARGLAEDHTLTLADMRNHGRSPHDDQMDYASMASDVVALMDKTGLERATVFGHSMGGKAAMQMALDHPDRVDRLIVGDIAPVRYGNHHARILEGMAAVAAAAPDNRKGAEEILKAYEDEPAILSFLLTNWRRGEKGVWRWRVNLSAIQARYDHIMAANVGDAYTGEVLFLRGGLSDYILPEHRNETLALFPKAQVRTVEGTGHWLHAEKPSTVERLIRRFVNEG